MAQWVGKDVLIPANAWDPPEDGPVSGYILKATAPTKRYPEGRLEIVTTTRAKFLFPAHTFPCDWVLDSTHNAPQRTPRKSGSRTTTTTTTPQPGLSGASIGAATHDVNPPIQQPLFHSSQHAMPQGSSSPTQPPEVKPEPHELVSPGRVLRSRAGPLLAPPPSPGFGTPDASRGLHTRTTPVAIRHVTFEGQEREAEQLGGLNATCKVTEVPRLSSTANFLNALLLVAVALPGIYVGWAVCHGTSSTAPPALPAPLWPGGQLWPNLAHLASLQWWQALGFHHPLLFVNLLFFFNVDVLFWVVAQLQGTTWLIDPYWTLLPPALQLLYQFHPRAQCNVWRGIMASTILRTWACRLTYSYFRREEWQFGAREDWRYSDLARQFTRHWWWLSFLATYLVQHAMLVGITLPLAAVYSSSAAWGPWDTAASIVALCGMVTSWVADNQLRDFMLGNKLRLHVGLEPLLLLDSGLWRYSRHPNYFGEQLYWWGMSLFAVGLGQPWMMMGTLFNSLCMIPVTQMTEARMLQRPERAQLFKEYQASTSCWLPWLPRRRGAGMKME
ncbi:hypothetical protein QJQ45_025638 [Haematococcus lacustris]|nr:hypothetical protein QJQ45_025638 [Haematococcus lacustris]